MRVTHQKLANGMTIATDEMREIETVSIVVQVQTGSANETPANQGLSHFLEHMAFKGTKSRSALEIAQIFDEIGGYFNAYTSREKTVYYAKVLKGDVLVAADILSDILQNSLFDEKEIERERHVILQEIAQTVDAPDDLIFDLFQEHAYPNQAFGRSILGTTELIKSVNRGQIIKYVDDNYFSANVIISAAGNISHQEFLKIAEEKFNRLPVSGNKYLEDIVYKGGEVRVERDLEQIHLVLGFESVPYTDPTYFDFQVLAIITGGGMSSKLFQEIREKRGLAYSVSAFCNNYSESGTFNFYVATSSDKVNECVDVIASEVHNLTTSITEEEIQRAKSQVRAGLLMSQESSMARAEKLSGNLGAYGRYLFVDEIMDKINKVDKSSLIAVAQKLFTQNSTPTLATIGKLDTIYKYDDIKLKFKY
ncbi:MAG: processing peptidase [Candidatus Midichloriaceae bacterium]|jgi:predicted Zn-dependent peptidase|nr:processing peptidase [Candidatus Midichloriaceae bacterium]